jgi:hypothetical protein
MDTGVWILLYDLLATEDERYGQVGRDLLMRAKHTLFCTCSLIRG